VILPHLVFPETNMHACLHVCVYACIHVCVHAFMCACMHAFMCACTKCRSLADVGTKILEVRWVVSHPTLEIGKCGKKHSTEVNHESTLLNKHQHGQT